MTDPAHPTVEIITQTSHLPATAGAVEALVLLASDLPEAEDDATDRIVQQILAADSPEDVNAIWEATGIERWLDVPLLITSLHRAPSDFEDGIGVYVVIKAQTTGDRRDVVITTGSVNVIAQLIKAHTSDWFPLVATPRGPKRPPKNGRFPYRLELGLVRVGR
jgi:hypothetical protein